MDMLSAIPSLLRASVPETWPLIASCFALVASGLFTRRFLRPAASAKRPPFAKGWIPILGHALQYKRNPLGFLQRALADSGGCVTLDLAGRRTVVVSCPTAMREVARAHESVLSAREAVGDFGFHVTLGAVNVHYGTDFHRRTLHSALAALAVHSPPSEARARQHAGMLAALRRAVEREFGPAHAHGSIPDAFQSIRRVMLAGVIDIFLGPAVLEHSTTAGWDMLAHFMAFQDGVEDATAAAAVLPGAVAAPLALAPVERRRRAIVKRLAPIIFAVWEAGGEGEGPWLRAMRESETLPRPADAFNESGVPAAANTAADLCCGLLFAGHKNPAIGAAQALCFLLEGGRAGWGAVCAEAGAVVAGAVSPRDAPLLRGATEEAVRLTAHNIGALRKVVAEGGFALQGGRYAVPQGAYIGVAHAAVHLDPEVWGPDAAEFRPERLGAARRGSPARDPFVYTAFSHGVHACPGQGVGVDLMTLTLALLLTEYDFARDIEIPGLDWQRATLAQRRGPVHLRFTPRVQAQHGRCHSDPLPAPVPSEALGQATA